MKNTVLTSVSYTHLGEKNDNNECICKGKHSTGDRGGRSGCRIAKIGADFLR